MAKTEEVKTEREDSATPAESKLLGFIEYRTGILFGLFLTLSATVWVFVMYEEE